MNVQLATLDYFKEQFIIFCFVCRNNVMSMDTFRSFNEWVPLAGQMGVQFSANTIHDTNGEKNMFTLNFHNTPGPTHILFVDSDVVFSPWHVLGLLSAKKHIVGAGGLAYDHKDDMAIEDDIREVSRIPESFMLISREALVHLDGKLYEEDISFFDRWREMGGRIWSHDQVSIKRA